MIIPAPAFHLIATVTATIQERRLLTPGDTVIVALSGGGDSRALLDILARLPQFPLHLVAAHLNHDLRGEESDKDEAFCRKLAEQQYGIPCISRTINVRELALQSRIGIEEAGRMARIAFLREIAQQRGAAAIALGHHADDQAETILMRLLRGAGSAGLSGMRFRNDTGFIRPLLNQSRAELTEYLRVLGLTYRTDSSNMNPAFLRNRIRHELIPLLKTYNPSLRDSLNRNAVIMTDDHDLMEQLALERYHQICLQQDHTVTCQIGSLLEEHPALQRRIVRRMIQAVSTVPATITYNHWQTVDGLLRGTSPNGSVRLPANVAIRRSYDRLEVAGSLSASTEPQVLFSPLEISALGTYPLPTGGIVVITSGESDYHSADGTLSPHEVHIDLATAPFPWQIRPMQPGDRISPVGMSGSKKVKDLFIDEKIPRDQRRTIPLVTCGEQIIWVCGLRLSSAVVAHNGTRESVRVRYVPPGEAQRLL